MSTPDSQSQLVLVGVPQCDEVIVKEADIKITYSWLIRNVFLSPETCLLWCVNKGLLRSERICPKCGVTQKWLYEASKEDKYIFSCPRPCRTRNGIRIGTWFESAKISPEAILSLTYFWCSECPQEFAQREIPVTYHTSADWYSFCQEVCTLTLVDLSEQIGGPGKVVEIDICRFGKRKAHRGRYADEWVFGGIERNSRPRKTFLVSVSGTNIEILLPHILNWIKPRTTITSDFWKAKSLLHTNGYSHVDMNKIEQLYNHSIDGSWLHVKRNHQIFGKEKHLRDNYFSEWLYRQKFGPVSTLFPKFLEHIKVIYPGK
ncbi:uncharacterized protein LOC144445316 [Glandiceps talaboti]